MSKSDKDQLTIDFTSEVRLMTELSLVEQALALRNKATAAMEAIQAFKTKQRRLYADYYNCRRDMDQFIENHKADASFKALRALGEIDDSSIFYNKRKHDGSE